MLQCILAQRATGKWEIYAKSKCDDAEFLFYFIKLNCHILVLMRLLCLNTFWAFFKPFCEEDHFTVKHYFNPSVLTHWCNKFRKFHTEYSQTGKGTLNSSGFLSVPKYFYRNQTVAIEMSCLLWYLHCLRYQNTHKPLQMTLFLQCSI